MKASILWLAAVCGAFAQEVAPDGRVTFKLLAPKASDVTVSG